MTRRKPGRPPLDPDDPDPSVKMTLRVPAAQFDAAHAQARALRVPLADYMREALAAAGRRELPPSKLDRKPPRS